MFQRVLICTDLNDGLQRLLRFVASLAAGGVESVTFLHVVPLSNEQIPREDVDQTQAVRDRLSALLTDVPAGLEVNIEVVSGKAVESVLAISKNHHSDLLITGMPRRNVLNEKLFGSNTMSICQRVGVPVMTLRPQLIATLTDEELDLRCRHLLQQLLIPYDGSTAGRYLLDQIKQSYLQGKMSGVKACHLCAVVPDISRDENLTRLERQQAEQMLHSVKTDLETLGLQVSARVLHGDPVVKTLEAAQDLSVSAIAIASDSLGKLREWSAPSFAGEVLRRSWHPVIYFPMSKSPRC